MKYRAHTQPSLNSEIIYIHDVIKQISIDPKRKEHENKYYSLWYLTPMVARCKGRKTPHFAYWPGSNPNPKESTSGMSLEHSTVQRWIEKNKKISLRRNQLGQITYGCIAFSEVMSEYQFKNSENGEIEYIADIYGKIEQDSILGLTPGTNLIIEIAKTNKVSKYKEAYYQKHNIAAIEISIWEKVKFNTDKKDTISAINDLDSIVNNWLNKGAQFKWVQNPNKKYLPLRKKQQKIELEKLSNGIVRNSDQKSQNEVSNEVLFINTKEDICNIYNISPNHNESFLRKAIRFLKTLIKQ